MRNLQSLTALSMGLCLAVLPFSAVASNDPQSLSVDWEKVRIWNNFADNLLKLHETRLQKYQVKTTTRSGGYPDFPDYYEETTYLDERSGKVLSRIKRISAQPALIHEIEVNIYNDQQQLTHDYLAAYLPYGRNAPVQTLINVHGYSDGLHAFRQFDASGERIYEQCRQAETGRILISLEYDELREGPAQNSKTLQGERYTHCFSAIPLTLANEMRPASLLRQDGQPDGHAMSLPDSAQVYASIKHLDKALQTTPENPQLWLKRADLYFQVHEFDLAVEDYSQALELNDALDQAYFGRGMALGRSGRIRDGIADLGVYIARNPQSSLAYTKRGVRYLWLGEEQLARNDFERALALDPKNAEAHDDLGVIYARNGQYELAIGHFRQTLEHDPEYAKGYHNLAMVHYITGDLQPALGAINKSLALTGGARDSMLLKVQILEALGHTQAARKLADEAEFLPEGNWSETLSIN